MRKRKTTHFQDFREDHLMKELKNLSRDKRSSIDENHVRAKIQERNIGQQLLAFDAKTFDLNLINFYLGDPETARRNAPDYKEPIVSSMKTNGILAFPSL